MASTLLNAVIQAPIYAINSTLVDRTVYPYGQNFIFGSGGIGIQANGSTTLQGLQAAATPGAALVYTRISSSTYPGTVFYSNLSVANIISALAT